MTDGSPTGEPVSKMLRELRAAAGLRQVDAAARAELSQSLIAKFENGRQVPRPDQVEALCRVYRAAPEVRRRLAQVAADMRADNQRVVLRRDAEPAQKRIGRIQEASTVQRTFSPIGVPGLLQTPIYCRALFEGDPSLTPAAAAAAVDARLANRAVLDSPRRFTFLLTEGGFGWALVPGAAMAEQLEHIAAESRRENVRLGVIPWGRVVPEIPLNSWTEYDDQLVIVGTMTRVAYLTVRADLDAYRRLFDYFSSFAVFDDEARTIVQAAARRYRRAKD